VSAFPTKLDWTVHASQAPANPSPVWGELVGPSMPACLLGRIRSCSGYVARATPHCVTSLHRAAKGYSVDSAPPRSAARLRVRRGVIALARRLGRL
jgi:hypothetical protein